MTETERDTGEVSAPRVGERVGTLVLLISTVLAVMLVLGSCSGDSSDSASRNSSNLNTRTLATLGSDIPTMPGANVITRGAVDAGSWHRTYEVQAAAAEVIAFYQQELPSAGWTEGATATTTAGDTEATWRRSGLRLDLTIAPSAAGTDPSTTASSSVASTVNLSLRRSSGA